MTLAAILPYPEFNPVLVQFGPFFIHWPVSFQLGPFSIRWYALAYISGLLIGWWAMRRLVRLPPAVATPLLVDDFLTWATLGVVLGGRLGYILFYQPGEYLTHPLAILQVWQGGMSFHGGMLGVVTALIIYCRRNAIPLLGFADRLSIVSPIGLGLGRIANFINGELWGRPTDVPWAMIFPRDPDQLPRHPSQLYQAFMEGLLLFLLVFTLSRFTRIRARFGFLTGAFLMGYGVARIIGEFFREPDPFLGYLWHGATMGQILSFPMILAGAAFVAHALRHPVRRAVEA
jgi:phosphatidylglycerol:prolipoprotein diacylglycerol transferase